MAFYFLGDAHISSFESKSFKIFKSFSLSLHPGEKLFLLGDFFNFFVGSWEYIPDNIRPILLHFKDISERGVELFFIEGNREFYSEYLLKKYGFKEVLKEMTLELDIGKVLLLHGDGVLKDEWNYRWMRFFLRNPITHGFAKALGGRLIYKIANGITSRKRPKRSSLIPKGYLDFAKNMAKRGYRGIIMGHVHREGIIWNDNFFYANTGEWFSKFTYIVYTGENRLEIKRWNIDKA